MVSTPSTRLRLEKQALGENLNTWGQSRLNDALERLDEAIAGVQAITISGASTTLTSTNYSTDQARKAALVLTGTLSANSTLTVPNVEKLYLIVNNTTQGAYSLTIKTAAGSGYALRPGPQQVYCNGTDVYRATPTIGELALAQATLDLNGQKIANLGTPTQLTDAATKLYVDIASTLRSMGGYRLYSVGAPVDPADAATKAYVDAAASSVDASGAAASASAAAGSATSAATSASSAATSATAAASSASAAAGSATDAAASAALSAGRSAVQGLNRGFEAYDAANVTMSNNGRTLTIAPGFTRTGRSDAGRASGKYYFEVRLDAGTSLMSFGVVTSAHSSTSSNSNIGFLSSGWALTNTTTDGYYHGSGTAVTTVGAFTPAVGDVYGIAVDLDTGKFWAARNGAWLTGDPAAGTGAGMTDVSGTVYPAIGSAASQTFTLRLARQEFSYAPPSGFTAWAGETDLANSAPIIAGTARLAGRLVADVVAASTSTLDLSLGQYFTRTISGASAFVFSAPPTTGAFEFTLEVIHTSGAITWPASVTWPAGTTPTLNTSKTHLFKFVTRDGGTKWRGMAWVDYTT